MIRPYSRFIHLSFNLPCRSAGLILILTLSILFFCSSYSHGLAPAEKPSTENPPSGVLTQPKKLNRFPDPIIIEGKWLPHLRGKEIASLRLYIFENKAFRPIRFQVDERTDEGDWIFPFGSKNNGGRSNHRLDPQDIIMFMAKDAGEEAPVDTVLPGASSFTPIQLTDPLDRRQAWIYLTSHQQPFPPLSPLPDYVRYDHEKARLYSLCVDEEFIITKDGLHAGSYIRQATPVSGGGSGENFVDRMKARVEIRFFFDLLPINITEEDHQTDIVAYICGPIRSLRRQEEFIQLPLGFRAFRSYADIANYESVGIVPVELTVPRGANRVVSSARIRIGTDYAPAVIGSYFCNSQNPEPLIIDGKMSPQERHFNPERDTWRTFYGHHGALFTRSIFALELLDMVELSQQYLDDLNSVRSPEQFPGSMGFAWSEVRTTDIRPGVYPFVLDFGHPAFFKPGDEGKYMKMRDHPVRIRIGQKEYSNPIDLRAKVGKDF